MAEDFMSELANADRYSNGNRFRAGRGTLVVKEVKIFKSKKPGGDPYSWVAEFLVKSSHSTVSGTEPNQAGTSVSTIQSLTRAKFPELAKSNALKAHMAILGPSAEALSKPELADRLKWLLRPGGPDQPKDLQGRTMPGTTCPARGYQVAYETVEGKDGKHYPEFAAVDTTDAQLAENLKLLAGADPGADAD